MTNLEAKGANAGQVLRGVLPVIPTLFNNDDTRFIPGRMLAAKRIIESTEACMYYLEGFSSFGISLKGLATLGAMDENFWPAYGEDCDYWFRAQLKGCRLFYRGGFIFGEKSVAETENAFVVHGDSQHARSTSLRSSKFLEKLVTNTLDTKRGRYAYLSQKWGLNACILYHEVMHTSRKEDTVLHALNETDLVSRGMKTKRPFGFLTDVNDWPEFEWRTNNSISPRGINSRWAPEELVWLQSDNAMIRELRDALGLEETSWSSEY